MNNAYGIAVVCVPSDRLITDENGEQFYECMTQEELEKRVRGKKKTKFILLISPKDRRYSMPCRSPWKNHQGSRAGVRGKDI